MRGAGTAGAAGAHDELVTALPALRLSESLGTSAYDIAEAIALLQSAASPPPDLEWPSSSW